MTARHENVISRSRPLDGSVPARAWAEVYLEAIEHNLTRIRELAAPAQVMAVVKADGYGHGAVYASRAALAAGASRLAVATLREAAELRRAGIDVPIQILGVILEGNESFLVELGDVVATVSTMDEARRLSLAAGRVGGSVKVHLKLDSGMHRLGASREAAEELARFLQEDPGLEFEGAMTHFAAAGSDREYTLKQIAEFDDFVAWLEAESMRPKLVHAANSATLALHPEARYDMVRSGLAAYGIADPAEVGEVLNLRPAMRLCARIVNVKRVAAGEPVGYGCTWRASQESVIATASIGYADGLRTSLSNRGAALVRGARVPVVGRVSMDFTALDVTELGDVRPGEEAVFFGRQGEAEITAAEAAASMDAIPYELICGVSFRVWRIAK
jgi:alanine racemase